MPIELEPNGVPVYVHKDFKKILTAEPTTETQLIIGDMYILAVGAPVDRWVKAHGFKIDEGGNVTSILFSENDSEFTIALVLPGKWEIPQGTNEITVDGYKLRAVAAADPIVVFHAQG
jgi:hypothetical protein